MSFEPTSTPHFPKFDPLILVEEMQHRVADEYALAVSSISLLARGCDKYSQSVLAHATDRLRDFAAVHNALQPPRSTGSIDLCGYLRTLCFALTRASLAESGVSLVLHELPVVLEARRAWCVGLILSELVVNALRHGAWPPQGGVIEIAVGSGAQDIRCCVSDNGGGARHPLPGRGTHILESLARELGGQIRRHFANTGTTILLTFPKIPEVS